MKFFKAKVDPILGGWVDGYPHERDSKGFCLNCGSGNILELNYALVPQERSIYRMVLQRFLASR